MSSLPTPLRRQLESAIKQAHKIAESGARHALEALAVHEPDPYRHMNEAQRGLRRQLRAQAKQLGDGESQTRRGVYEIKHLAEKLAYDQWHRLLFARYLLENDLLISPDHGVSVSLNDCEELGPSLGLKDAWAVAARFAAKELPEIFRADDPAGAVDLSVNDRKPLIELVTGLAVEVFTAGDSLGWCYQFWQVERKEEVNASGNKIGADELPAVTQLFTEDYMVDFLLDNTLGAWYACKVLAANPTLANTAQSEDELRNAMALPGCPWKYLRFVRSNIPSPSAGESRGEGESWTPAAGIFDGWPKTAQELRCLDPCMGSGHFVVAMFERLVALRLAEEKLDEAAAVAAVIRDNVFGLEIDPRCTQIGAFNLALAAWRRVGHCKLPAMNLACSGLAPNTREADWLAIAGDNQKLQRGMERLYRLFQKAAVLGSLINPRAGEGDLLVATFHELQPLLEKALAQETKDDTAHEMAVTARGLAKAAEILAGQFTLVATNVPYLSVSKHEDFLREHGQTCYPESRHDLATMFVERFLPLAITNALVTPQNWLFMPRYKKLRQRYLKDSSWHFACKLGPGAFETISGEVVKAALIGISQLKVGPNAVLFGVDASESSTPAEKASRLMKGQVAERIQSEQLLNPDARIVMEDIDSGRLLMALADSRHGLRTADGFRFLRFFWELPTLGNSWSPEQGTVERTIDFSGREQIVLWEGGQGALREFADVGLASLQGGDAWGKQGVTVSLMGALPVTRYAGDFFDNNCAALWPKSPKDLAAVWAFCSSSEFSEQVRVIDQQLKVTSATLLKVPFDLAHWQKVAAEKYPHGLPKPFSSDPTQWLFNGHPAGADQPLHVAVARLLGYQWPRQTGSSFPDCPALDPDGLEKLADEDGIVCFSATKGEAPAAERLRGLLVHALGSFDLGELLAGAGPKGSKSGTLEEWLRDEFFEQHCAFFHHRPFIWHVWDGHKSGFGALLNYHQLTHTNLEKLTYAYLGDWIRRQQAAVDAGEAGSDARLQAARNLQVRLKLILEGEPPYDVFVRWRPLSEQAIGCHPDINDGVRMNIRPFLAQDIPGGKKGAGILRTKPNIKWEKDRGKEPVRDKAEYPWFWGWDGERQDFTGLGKAPDGNRWNACHYSNEFKRKARGR
ncbi:SAM-dependent DNA methyltransferase [Candidatus Accumulibacter sp. ACC005]|uniref:Eco57I restriction-modification methylase domain-containing protein n=1 Tax=Candidatus Accumulibacter sp. ACC005 TaxID=2823331 RepID=UPI0025BCC844|nr:SAM-dependent DNA methyltransferase [Candidatus Accumulibacter sp. ACC005]